MHKDGTHYQTKLVKQTRRTVRCKTNHNSIPGVGNMRKCRTCKVIRETYPGKFDAG